MIDPRVASLVDALNRVPGVQTFASCGGHDRPGPGQAAVGEFYVDFLVTEDAQGWGALAVLAEVCMPASITAWFDGYLMFSLAGDADPSAIAEKVAALSFAH